MKLNQNSISAKLYRWFYDLNDYDDMPSNLCPYFWKLLFMWVMILPYVVVTLPIQIITKFRQKSFTDAFVYLFIFFAVLFIICVLLALPIRFFVVFVKEGFWDGMLPASVVCWGMLVLLSLYYGVEYLIERFRYGRKFYDENGDRYYGIDSEGYKIYYKTKKPSIIVEFIKAKYNKYCPQIEWSDEKNND